MNVSRVSRRHFLATIGTALGSSILAACSPTPVAPTATPQAVATTATEPTAAPATPAPASPVTITHWDFGGSEFEYVDKLFIPAFSERFPNIKIEHVGVPEDGFDTKVKTAVSSGTQPDTSLCFDNTWWKAGLCVPLDEFLSRVGIDWQKDYPQGIVRLLCAIDDGKLYGMPFIATIKCGAYNVGIFDKAGIPLPTVKDKVSYAQWYEWAKLANVPSTDIKERIWGAALPSRWDLFKHAWSNPTWAGPDGRTALGNIDSEGWIQAYGYMAQAYREDLTPKDDVATGLGGDPFRLGQEGWRPIGEYPRFLEPYNDGVNVALCQHPFIGSGNGATGLAGGTTPWTVFKATKSVEQAWEWVHHIGTDGAVAFAEAGNDPPALRRLAEQMKWAEKNVAGADVMWILGDLPAIPFTPSFSPIVEPMNVAWTRITEENVPVEQAIHEAAVEVQANLDKAWEEWEELGRSAG